MLLNSSNLYFYVCTRIPWIPCRSTHDDRTQRENEHNLVPVDNGLSDPSSLDIGSNRHELLVLGVVMFESFSLVLLASEWKGEFSATTKSSNKRSAAQETNKLIIVGPVHQKSLALQSYNVKEGRLTSPKTTIYINTRTNWWRGMPTPTHELQRRIFSLLVATVWRSHQTMSI